ncbi:MAG: Ig-like domain-containing protein [Arenicellales bacterium WSBS_2016_MAG_OTU3]
MLTITPDGTADITISINSGIAMNSDSNTNAASNMLTVAYTAPADTTPPTVMLTGAPTAVNASTLTFEVTATFSEAVNGFDQIADITVTNGTAAVPAFVSEGIYTLTITPAGAMARLPSPSLRILQRTPTTLRQHSLGAVTVTYDNTPPTATFTGTDSVSNTDEFPGNTDFRRGYIRLGR